MSSLGSVLRALSLLLMSGLLLLTEAGQAALEASGGNMFEALGRVPGAHACLALAIALTHWQHLEGIGETGLVTHLGAGGGRS